MEVPEAPLLAYCYESLSHEVRRDIIRLIGSFSHISYTELIEYLEIKPGSFFYHVKKMPELIDQTESKEYILTEKGKLCYQMLRRNEERVNSKTSVDTTPNAQNISQNRVSSVNLVQKHTNKQFLLLGNFFRNLTLDWPNYIMVGGLILIQMVILYFTEFGLVVPFFFSPLFYYDPVILLIEFIGVLLFEWLFIEVASTLFIESNMKFSFEILLALPFCNIPLYLYPISEYLIGIFFPSLPSLFTFSLSLILQLWTALVLAQSVQIHKSVSYEKALLPVIFLMYVSSMFTFFLS